MAAPKKTVTKKVSVKMGTSQISDSFGYKSPPPSAHQQHVAHVAHVQHQQGVARKAAKSGVAPVHPPKPSGYVTKAVKFPMPPMQTLTKKKTTRKT
jgi:hypothetical protein